MSKQKNEPQKENNKQESEQKQEKVQEMELFKETPIKRIFNHEKVSKYYKNQKPPINKGQKFIDKIFPPIIDSLKDRSNKSNEIDRINIQEIDWK